jgi:hypothetical protein
MLVVRGGIAEASWPHLATTGGSPFLRGSPLTRGEEELYRRDPKISSVIHEIWWIWAYH